MENDQYCILFNKDIDEGLCYDIWSVISGFIKKETIKEKINVENAKVICKKCGKNE